MLDVRLLSTSRVKGIKRLTLSLPHHLKGCQSTDLRLMSFTYRSPAMKNQIIR